MKKRQRKIRLSMNLSINIEMKAREKAYRKGFIKNNNGNLSEYIQFLVKKDLTEKKNLSIASSSFIDTTDTTVLNITLASEDYESMRERAKELGFIRYSKGYTGNITAYIRFLLMVDIADY